MGAERLICWVTPIETRHEEKVDTSSRISVAGAMRRSQYYLHDAILVINRTVSTTFIYAPVELTYNSICEA